MNDIMFSKGYLGYVKSRITDAKDGQFEPTLKVNHNYQHSIIINTIHYGTGIISNPI